MCSCHSPLILNYVILSHSHSLLNNPLTHTFTLIIFFNNKKSNITNPPPFPRSPSRDIWYSRFPSNYSRKSIKDAGQPLSSYFYTKNCGESKHNWFFLKSLPPTPWSQYPWIALQFWIKRQKITIYLNRLKNHWIKIHSNHSKIQCVFLKMNLEGIMFFQTKYSGVGISFIVFEVLTPNTQFFYFYFLI